MKQPGGPGGLRNLSSQRPWVATFLPLALIATAVLAAVMSFRVFDQTFAEATFWQKAYSTLALFVGGYIGLDAELHDPDPPAALAPWAILAFGTTVTAAVALVVSMSAQARDAVMAVLARPRLVVIGSDGVAAAIVRSCGEHRIASILVTEGRDSEAARSRSRCTRPVVVRSVEQSHRSLLVRWVVKRGHRKRVVVATDSDALNLQLRSGIREIFAGQDDFDSVIAVVRDARLADAVRPAILPWSTPQSSAGTIGGDPRRLPPADVTCPAENVAEHITHLVDAASTGDGVFRPLDEKTESRTDPVDPARKFVNIRDRQLIDEVVVRVVAAGSPETPGLSTSLLSETIGLWVKRQGWTRACLEGGDEDPVTGELNPIVPVRLAENATPGLRHLEVRIHTGDTPSAAMASFLRDRALTPNDLPGLTVVIADEGMAGQVIEALGGRWPVYTGREWLDCSSPMRGTADVDDSSTRDVIVAWPLLAPVVIVDHERIGLDARLVEDDINLQWAREFNQTYDFMWAAGSPINAWEPGAPLADECRKLERHAVRTARRQAKPQRLSRQESAQEELKVRKLIANRYSNLQAVNHMLLQLQQEGWQLVRYDGDGPPPKPLISDELRDRMAMREHDHWRTRTWDPSRRWWERGPLRPPASRCSDNAGSQTQGITGEALRYLGDHGTAEGAPADLPLPELPHGWLRRWVRPVQSEHRLTAGELIAQLAEPERQDGPEKLGRLWRYNQRIITETYPAIAAMFGYRIVAKDVGEAAPWPVSGDASSARGDVA